MFCAPCRLFGGISSLATSGYHDWKNISARLCEHENLTEHKTCALTMVKRDEISGRIDTNLKFQMADDIIYWRNVLKRIVAMVKKLSSRGLAFRVVELYNSLIGYINSIRDSFDMYEGTAKEKSETEDYEFDARRKRKRKLQSDETREVEVEMCDRDKFKVDTFLTILDLVCSTLKRRSNAYQETYGRFHFLSNITNTSTTEITVHAKKLQLCYQGDLEESFVNECPHFRSDLEGVEIPENEKKSILRYCSLLRNQNIHSVYPNILTNVRLHTCYKLFSGTIIFSIKKGEKLFEG
ncbi:unnamed protein product [Caretta caretta]